MTSEMKEYTFIILHIRKWRQRPPYCPLNSRLYFCIRYIWPLIRCIGKKPIRLSISSNPYWIPVWSNTKENRSPRSINIELAMHIHLPWTVCLYVSANILCFGIWRLRVSEFLIDIITIIKMFLVLFLLAEHILPLFIIHRFHMLAVSEPFSLVCSYHFGHIDSYRCELWMCYCGVLLLLLLLAFHSFIFVSQAIVTSLLVETGKLHTQSTLLRFHIELVRCDCVVFRPALQSLDRISKG